MVLRSRQRPCGLELWLQSGLRAPPIRDCDADERDQIHDDSRRGYARESLRRISERLRLSAADFYVQRVTRSNNQVRHDRGLMTIQPKAAIFIRFGFAIRGSS